MRDAPAIEPDILDYRIMALAAARRRNLTAGEISVMDVTQLAEMAGQEARFEDAAIWRSVRTWVWSKLQAVENGGEGSE